jgi:hypothetical protein
MKRCVLLILVVAIAVVVTAWAWIPDDEHPCTITRWSEKKFVRKFGSRGLPPLYHQPVVIVRDSAVTNTDFRSLTRRENLLEFFGPDFSVTLSSSNALSEHRRTIPLQQYLNESWNAVETKPDQLSNETWYLFGETYSDEWKALLQHYELPLCHTCRADLVALSFGIGNRGSGVQWHVHGPGFSEALHGRKHWVLYPPSSSSKTIAAAVEEDTNFYYDKDQSSRHWMEVTYPIVSPKPFECTLNPGDVIYFPNHWWHATINLDRYTAFVSTFTSEHNVTVVDDDSQSSQFSNFVLDKEEL